jgi:hypothetical protein
MDEYTVTTLARLRQEEIAREVAQFRRATLAERRPGRSALRRQLATVLVAVAAWLAPTEQPAVEIIEAGTASS